MTLQLLIRPEALQDLDDAYDYYESCMQGLGDDFLASVKSTLDVVLETPNLYPKVLGDLQRALTRRFPFGLFYLVSGNQVVVLACLHIRRSPKAWRSRLH